MLVTDWTCLSSKTQNCHQHNRSQGTTQNILNSLSLYDRIRSIAICDNGCWIAFCSFWLLSLLVTLNIRLLEIKKWVFTFFLFEANRMKTVLNCRWQVVLWLADNRWFKAVLDWWPCCFQFRVQKFLFRYFDLHRFQFNKKDLPGNVKLTLFESHRLCHRDELL